jgi:DHA2 family multidrug resistance protein-like MFS transporter
VIGSVIYSLGISPVVILATDLIVGSAPVERAGAASAISETSSELGGALGIAILGSIGTAVYRSTMAHALPAGVPPQAAEAARSTLGGALAEAGRLVGPVGTELMDSARQAFVRALEVASAISAGVSLMTAILIVVLLRGVRAGSQPALAPEPALSP